MKPAKKSIETHSPLLRQGIAHPVVEEEEEKRVSLSE